MCDLPGPRRPYKEQAAVLGDERTVARSRMRGLGVLGLKDQSKVSSVFTWGMPACLRRRAKRESVLASCCSELSVAGIFFAFSFAEWPKGM